MTPRPDLSQVLAALDAMRCAGSAQTFELLADAALLLRELAADFELYAWHTDASQCDKDVRTETDCTCGLDAARARWRLPR